MHTQNSCVATILKSYFRFPSCINYNQLGETFNI